MLMAAPTTKISPSERYPSGDKKPQADEQRGRAPTLVKRIVEHAVRLGSDRRVGTVLGIMHLEGTLSESECEAGFAYAEDVGAYEHMKGHPSRHSQSPSFEFGRKGADGLDLEALHRMDPETAEKIERRIKRKRKAIQMRYDRAQACVPLHPILICALVEEVCCNDRPIHSLHHPMLKKILRNLAERCYGLVQPGEGDGGERKKRTSRKADAAMVASAAVDALEQWFRGRRHTITEFNVVGSSITGHGHDAFNKVVAHTVECRRSKLMSEMVAAQLLKAAEGKGWAEQRQVSAQVEVNVEAIRAGIRRKE